MLNDTVAITITGNSKGAQDAIRQVLSGLRELTSTMKAALGGAATAGAGSTTALRETAAGLRSMGAAASAIGQQMQMAGGAITGAFAVAVKSGSDFNQKLLEVRNNTTMTASDFRLMSDTIKRLGSESSAPLGQLADGFMHITNLGFKAADAAKILKEAMKSAVATGGDTGSISNILAGALHQFNLPATRAQSTMNLLHYGAALGNMTLPEFSTSAGPALATAGVLGDPLPDAIAALSALTRRGFNPAEAATQFRNMLIHIAHPSGGGKKGGGVKALLGELTQETGVDLLGDFSFQGIQNKGTFGILGDVRTAAQRSGQDPAELTTRLIPAIRGGIGAGTLAGKGAGDFAATHDAAQLAEKGTTDPTGDAFKRAQATFQNQMGVLRNNMTLLAATVSQILVPAITPLIKGLTEIAQAFGQLPEPMQKFMVLGGALAGVGLLIGGSLLKSAGSVLLIRSYLVDLAAEGVTVSGALEGFATALTGPVGVAIVAGVAAIAGLALAYRNNWLGIRDATNAAVSWMKPFLASAWGAILADSRAVWGALKDFFGRTWPAIATVGRTVWGQLAEFFKVNLTVVEVLFRGVWANIEGLLRGVWQVIVGVVKVSWGVVAGTITVGLQLLSGNWRGAWDSLKQYVSLAWNGIKDVVAGAMKGIGNLVAGFGRVLFNAGEQMVLGLIGGIRAGGGAIVQAVQHVLQLAVAAARAALGIHSPSQVFLELGQRSAEGYIQGIESGKLGIAAAIRDVLKVPSIRAANGALAGAGAPAAPANALDGTDRWTWGELRTSQMLKEEAHPARSEATQRARAERTITRRHGFAGLDDPRATDDQRKTMGDEVDRYMQEWERNRGRWAAMWQKMGKDAEQNLTGLSDKFYSGLLSGQRAGSALSQLMAGMRDMVIQGLSRALTLGTADLFRGLFGGTFGSLFGGLFGGGGQGAGDPAKAKDQQAAADGATTSLKTLSTTFKVGSAEIATAMVGLVSALGLLSGSSGGKHHGGLFGTLFGLAVGILTGGTSLALDAAAGAFGGSLVDGGNPIQSALAGWQLGSGFQVGTPPIIGPSSIAAQQSGTGNDGRLRGGGLRGGGVQQAAPQQVINITQHVGVVNRQVDIAAANQDMARMFRRSLREF